MTLETAESSYRTTIQPQLSVVADSNNTVIANLPLQKQPQGIAFDSGKGELFVTYSESNKVSVISDGIKEYADPSFPLPKVGIVGLILVVAVAVTLFAVAFREKLDCTLIFRSDAN